MVEENINPSLIQGYALEKLWRKFYNKTKTLPVCEQRLRMRTLGSALAIIDRVHGYPFAEMSINLEQYESRNPSPEFFPFYREQIELANTDQEAFCKSLHSCYNRMERRIKREQLLPRFFEFLKTAQQVCLTEPQNNSECFQDIANAFTNLLMQQLTYLKDDKYDFQHVIAGIDTNGKLLLIPDIYPNFDMMSFELMRLPSEQHTKSKVMRLAEKYGYKLQSQLDCTIMEMQDKNFTSIIDGLLPYIDETTIDILPQKPHCCEVGAISMYGTSVNLHTLTRKLKKRAKSLPADGFLVTINDCYFHSVLLRERQNNNRTTMLYRLSTAGGDLSGFFDVETGFFFSTVVGENTLYAHMVIESIILLVYASGVLDDSDYDISTFERRVHRRGTPVKAVIESKEKSTIK